MLKEGDYQQRSAFAELMLEIIEENEDAIIMMSDEAHFHLNGSVNKQNFHKIPMKCTKDRCTARKWRFGVLLVKLASLVRTFFEENGITTTVNSARYIDIINNFLEPELRSRRINKQNVWFQQDGAIDHTARAAMAVVRAMFPDRLISRCGDVPWLPRSPDLSMCNFFFFWATSSHM